MSYLNISNLKIKSLKDYFEVHPEHAGVTNLDCSDNQLTTLNGCPTSVTRLNCSDNQLTSLVGCPNSVTWLSCTNNQLTTLNGFPSSVTSLYCFGNNLDPIYKDNYCVPMYKNKHNVLIEFDIQRANHLVREKMIAETYLLMLRFRFFHSNKALAHTFD